MNLSELKKTKQLFFLPCYRKLDKFWFLCAAVGAMIGKMAPDKPIIW